MADYAIGDLQGCFKEFNALLQKVAFNPSKDHLYLVGDIVARGPNSLACLDYVYTHQNSITVTLGNHDLHMIACYLLNQSINPKDKLEAIFQSPNLPLYIAYLQTQPLALNLTQHNCFISHAGLNPQWSIAQAMQHAKFAQQCYSAHNANHFFKQMYQPHPNHWHSELSNDAKFRHIVNYFTRMRFITTNNQLNFDEKNATDSTSALQPWFTHPAIKKIQQNIIFGHWASLAGKTTQQHVYALDTGCVWGGEMTLLNLASKEKISEKSSYLYKKTEKK